MRLARFTIYTQMTLLFAGATHASQSRVRDQIRVTLKTPLSLSPANFLTLSTGSMGKLSINRHHHKSFTLGQFTNIDLEGKPSAR
jgi:hypothetical protein